MPMIRAMLRLRNDAMLSARERLGYTQLDVAGMSGLQVEYVRKMERMDFDFPDTFNRVEEVASVLGLKPEDVMPKELARKVIPSRFVQVVEMGAVQLENLSDRAAGRFILPSPVDVASRREMREHLKGFHEQLPYVERKVMEGRKNGLTLEQIGRRLGLSPVRVRQVDIRAKRRVRQMSELFSRTEFAKEEEAHERTQKEREWERTH